MALQELACYYKEDAIDDDWLLEFKHVVLIRDPEASLESFYRCSLKEETTTYFDEGEVSNGSNGGKRRVTAGNGE